MSIYLMRKKLFKSNTKKLLLTLLAFCFISFFVGFISFVVKLPTEDEIPNLKQHQLDGGIVFTGGQFRLGTISLIIKNNFIEGPILISGVYPGENLSQTFLSLGLDNEQIKKIQMDYMAVSTVSNIKQAFDWSLENNLNKVLLVTSYYHIPRVKMLLEQLKDDNIEFVLYPVFSNNTNIRILLSEYIKVLLFNFKTIINFSALGQLPY